MQEEVVVPFRVPREQARPATEFKSTWMNASQDALRARGHWDRYVKLLPARHADAIVHAIAGTWLPVELCLAHYRACDGLGLSTQEQIAIGRDVLNRLQKTIFSLGFRAAREAGITPWQLLKLLPAQFDREWRGGACGIFKTGPKDARVEVIEFPCAAIPYARVAIRGVIGGLCELVCSKAYVHDVRELCDDMTVAYRVAWA